MAVIIIVGIIVSTMIAGHKGVMMVHEGYLTNQDANNLKTSKSWIYVSDSGGINLFFSDGRSIPENSVYFRPSNNDIICKLGNTEMVRATCNTKKFTLEHVSSADVRTPFNDLRYNCSRVMISSEIRMELPDPLDARVRILTGVYDFSKTCLTMEVYARNVIQRLNQTTVFMDCGSYSTKLFFLLRPSFIRGAECKPMKVLPRNTRYYSGWVGRRIPVTFINVQDTRIGGDYVGAYSDINSIIRNNAANAIQQEQDNIRIPVYMYYMNFVHNLKGVYNMPSNVCTLYILPTTKQNSNNLQIGTSVAVKIMGNAVQVFTRTGKYQVGRSFKSGSIVVVTVSTSMMLMTSMDSGTGNVEMLRIDGQQIAAFSVNQMREIASRFGPPRSIFPYTNICIPNLADIALRLQILRG
jgi:hypothetical protein